MGITFSLFLIFVLIVVALVLFSVAGSLPSYERRRAKGFAYLAWLFVIAAGVIAWFMP